jgi:anthranilate phosphoribosyltransferase (EC 2.4.2.18)
MIKEAIERLVKGEDLSREQARECVDIIMSGQATQAQIGAFLAALSLKGETVDEITGAALAMRSKARKIDLDIYCVDTCGTGGDKAETFNISTAAAFVAAAAGVPVAKHGNRSVSSRCGSADVLEALGVITDLPSDYVARCIKEIGIGFMFAPIYHTAMKHAAGPRKELGIRTIFNILGPLTNPAGVKAQVLGVYDGALVSPMANVLANLGIDRAMVVHGSDGLDEITVTGETMVNEINGVDIAEYTITPEQFGLQRAPIGALKGGDPQHNAAIIRAVFMGQKGAYRDAVVLNGAAAIYVGKKADTLEQAVSLARKVIDDGMAYAKLEQLVDFCRRYEAGRLEADMA